MDGEVAVGVVLAGVAGEPVAAGLKVVGQCA